MMTAGIRSGADPIIVTPLACAARYGFIDV